MFKVNNRNIKTRCERKMPEQRQWLLLTWNIFRLVFVFLYSTLSRQMPAGKELRKAMTKSEMKNMYRK